MGKYGSAAILAVKLCHEGKASSPNDAWEIAVAKTFPSSKSSQAKGCPRCTFLGLCSIGAVSGISEGSYTRSEKNKKYALKALTLLSQEPSLARNEDALWRRVIGNIQKVPNHQMDVVISIWNTGLIRAKGEKKWS